MNTRSVTYIYEKKRRNPKIIDSVVVQELTGIVDAIADGKELDYQLFQKRTQVNDSVKVILNEILLPRYEEEIMIMCYEPRNGILFFDENDDLLGYLEICFSCQNEIGFHFLRVK